MGWSYGTNPDGKEVGYSVSAICEHKGCDVKIDRGLAYVCGTMHGFDDVSCDGYFCYEHLIISEVGQLCDECYNEHIKERFENE